MVGLAQALHHDQCRLVITAAAFADSGEWAADGAASAGPWLATIADVVIAAEFAAGRLSYANARILTRVTTTDNEAELAALARSVPASDLGCAPSPSGSPHTWPPPPSLC